MSGASVTLPSHSWLVRSSWWALLPRANVVKGLNTVVAEVMVDPSLTGGEPDMFIAGDSDQAKRSAGGDRFQADAGVQRRST